MRIYARLENEKGKVDGMGANEYLDIDITVGNVSIEKLTVKQNENGSFQVFNKHYYDIEMLQDFYDKHSEYITELNSTHDN